MMSSRESFYRWNFVYRRRLCKFAKIGYTILIDIIYLSLTRYESFHNIMRNNRNKTKEKLATYFCALKTL